MFTNNFKWVFFVILFALFGVLVKFDPMNWWGTYDVDQSMMSTVMIRKPNAITTLPEGINYDVASGSTLSWEARKVGGFHTGTLNLTNGVLVVSSGEVVGAQFDIDMNSIINSDLDDGVMNTKLVGELKEFFNVATYPTAKFFLTSYSGDMAQGDLTLNGITKTIEFPAAIVVKGQTATIKADFFIQRSEWNLTKWEGVVQEELKISFDLTATTTDTVEAATVSTGSIATGSVATGDVMTGSVATGDVATGTTTSGSIN